MSFIEVNGAQLYYELFGVKHSDRTPVVLIHGATETGRSDWQLVAPLLARTRQVIVFDSRGHGQSTDPKHDYKFKQLASDTAELIQALGYERAHVIGHSNGGNVALVTLVEHPDVVQTAVLQAANAYVSPDLVAKEPPLFDPKRVLREDPDWMEEMVTLHGPTHGEEYWRDLLQMTVQEIIVEPNYTPEDLAQVQRPVLVIQGELDRVNAQAHHAQFIARHVPDAELWIPKGVGHNVHEEMLFDWVEHVQAFLKRRGNEANDALYHLKHAHYNDDRETIFDVHVLSEPSQKRLEGRVLTDDQRLAALESLPDSDAQVDDEVHVLLKNETPWALVNWSVANLRRGPGTGVARVSQVLMGEVVRVLETRDDWAHVRVENDGYLGWVKESVLHRCEFSEVQAYRATCEIVVSTDLAAAYQSPVNTRDVVGKLPFGVVLPMEGQDNGFVAARLPDGRLWWLSPSNVLASTRRPGADPRGIAFTLTVLRRFVGVPYLWGGRTPFGFDCSGLAQAFLGFMGVHVPRDADQQFRVGTPIVGATQPGDLLFFGDAVTGAGARQYRNITHVAIALADDALIHANGMTGNVSVNSLKPTHPAYMPWLQQSFVGARRFV